jgi:mannan endo-1,4-beta-mannosidase
MTALPFRVQLDCRPNRSRPGSWRTLSMVAVVAILLNAGGALLDTGGAGAAGVHFEVRHVVAQTTTTGAPAAGVSLTSPSRIGASDAATPTADAHLTLGGKPYAAIGVNAYELATDWGINAGCGPMLSDSVMDSFFASLPRGTLVRFWAFQGTMATNVETGQIDWAPLDRVFAAAAQYGLLLIPVLTSQGGSCDGGHWQDPSWYEGGFLQADNDPALGQGATPLSYWAYVQQIVQRYEGSPALGMWEPISEAEASTCPAAFGGASCEGHQTCPDEQLAALALRHFFDVVGGEIHTLDPNHLVESGLLGSGQCGTVGPDYEYVSASPGIDVLSYHDYYPADEPVGGDQYNGLGVRFEQAAALGKPIIGGESGIVAGSGTGCIGDEQRVADMADKVRGQLAAGSSGVLFWDWVPSLTQACNWDIAPGDPLVAALASLNPDG